MNDAPTTDFQILKAMLDRAGIKYKAIFRVELTQIIIEHGNTVTEFTFGKHDHLGEIGGYRNN